MGPSLWQALDRLYSWQREHLPGIETRQGMALLIWLLKREADAQPVGELYRSVSFSEPTMRDALRLFIKHGLAVATADGNDSRRRLVSSTPKLRRVVDEYRYQLALPAGRTIDADPPAGSRGAVLSSMIAALRMESSEGVKLAEDLVNNSVCSLYHDASLPGLVVVWKACRTSLQFRFVLEVILQMLQAQGTCKVLGDDTNLGIIGAEDRKWVIDDWIPRARAAGFRIAATKRPRSRLGARAVHDIHAAAEGLAIRAFSDLSVARRWLQNSGTP